MEHHFINSQVANCTDLVSPAGESLLAPFCGPSWALALLYHLFSNAQTDPLPTECRKSSCQMVCRVYQATKQQY